MKKIIEKNLAEIIVLTVFSVAFLSSCGQKATCNIEVPHYHDGELYTNYPLDCENCDELD